MAIKNASDLLVYKKTSPAQPQITRIKIKSSTPLKDFTSGQNIIINNIADPAIENMKVVCNSQHCSFLSEQHNK